MDQNNKITLDDMVNEKSPETIAKEKEVLLKERLKIGQQAMQKNSCKRKELKQ